MNIKINQKPVIKPFGFLKIGEQLIKFYNNLTNCETVMKTCKRNADIDERH